MWGIAKRATQKRAASTAGAHCARYASVKSEMPPIQHTHIAGREAELLCLQRLTVYQGDLVRGPRN
eukprot:431183-Amphidinium_carterae.1